jgi:hypothetical protein
LKAAVPATWKDCRIFVSSEGLVFSL